MYSHMTLKMATTREAHIWLYFVLVGIACFHVRQTETTRTFGIDYKNNTFVKDGQPFRYISGSMHYSRVHPHYWQDRLLKMRAAGLNAVQTYVPWNVHELAPGNFYWDGPSDLGNFLTLAQKADLVVLLRMGPYICGEWEFGGFPAWLLTENPEMIFRTSDNAYIKWVDKWYTALLNYIKPYLYENGGPVVMVQIENEYGSYFACDRIYLDFLLYKVKAVLGTDVTIYTTDGCGLHFLRCGKISGAYATVDFGYSQDPKQCFAAEKFYEKEGPMVNSEYYTGWLDHWGSPHSTRDSTGISKRLDEMLALGANVNMYMFVGGTNFGFMNGANSPSYTPVPTSYDYDSPLNEAGDITPKYYALRDIISKYNTLPPTPIPPNTKKANYGKIQMELVSTLQEALPYLAPSGPVKSEFPVPMESIKFYFGFILYRFSLTTNFKKPTPLFSEGIRDRAIVMVNSVPFGIMDRDVTTLNITGGKGQFVDILVENQGRVGFSTNMNFNRKGIIGNVTLNGQIVSNWQIYPLNLDNINSTLIGSINASKIPAISADKTLMTPSIYVGSVPITDPADEPQDTFLDPTSWGKGQAIVNSFNLGRYWPGRGPQVTLYVPKPAFDKAPYQLYLLELEHAPCSEGSTCYVTLTDKPYIDGPVGPGSNSKQ